MGLHIPENLNVKIEIQTPLVQRINDSQLTYDYVLWRHSAHMPELFP